jgi:hypothetical protein
MLHARASEEADLLTKDLVGISLQVKERWNESRIV